MPFPYRALRLGSVFCAFLLAQPALSQNLLQDPTFSAGISANWSIQFSPALDWITAPGVDGRPGFAHFSSVGPGGGTASACVEVSPNLTYSSSVFLRVHGGQRLVLVSVVAYDDLSCHGVAVASNTSDTTQFPEDVWQSFRGPDVTTPAGAHSAQLRIQSYSFVPGIADVSFDNAYFGVGAMVLTTIPTLPEWGMLALAILLLLSGLLVASRRSKENQRA
jgi:hypothetical protein